MMDPSDLIPVMAIAFLGGTTLVSILGAYALGKSRRRDVPNVAPDPELAERVERVERLMETMAIEIERIGEGQRFLIKVLGSKQLSSPDAPRTPERVITPH
jgi:hypothetical protein